MLTVVVVLTAAQPDDPAIVQVTVQVPTALALGIITPVPELMLKPAGLAVYAPPGVPV